LDPSGFSVLSPKERTTVEREIKQLLKGLDDDLSNIENNRNSQANVTQTSSLSSSTIESPRDNQSTSVGVKTNFSKVKS
jgi:hypothetical protein